MSLYCPRCRQVLTAQPPICPEHGLHGVREAALERAEDAPLLGYMLEKRYALTDYLGGGGMGAVYKARQLSIDRIVAIKVLHASLTATREDRKRFEDEARAISQLQSPHTVTLYDYGLVRDGALANLAYMVLEYVEGETLGRRARAGAQPPETVARILDGVADALDEAHAHGIVHRDLKPANILLSYDHRGLPQVKVIDFGVARINTAEGLTRTGFSVGTPSYMAPEQFEAEAQIDGRADVYAMGVVSYVLLTGHKPFHSGSVLELARLHRTTPPPGLPGSEHDARLRAIEGVVHRAMAKQPGARFPTIGAYARAFHAAIDASEAAPPAPTAAVPLVFEPPAEADPAPLPTPTESFIGAVGSDPPPPPPRGRAWLYLALTIAIGGTAGAWLAMRLSGPETQRVGAGQSTPEVVVAVPGPPKPTPTTPPPERTPPTTPPAPATTAVPVAPPTASAPTRPPARTRRPKPTRPKRATVDPQVKPLIGSIGKALRRCQCRQARSTLARLENLDGGSDAARRIRPKVEACVIPDVDERCREGRVAPR